MSSAALAVVKRSGAGKLRHINISLLWVQEQEKLKKLAYEKVPGQEDRPADLFTKGVGREKLQQFAWASGQIFLDGRAETSLQVQGICWIVKSWYWKCAAWYPLCVWWVG